MNRSIICATLFTLSPLHACLTPSIVASQDVSTSQDAMASQDASVSHDAAPAGDAVEEGSGSTSLVQTCPQGATNQSLGIGFNALRPGECSAARGPDHAVTSIADVSSLLVGSWTSCGESPFRVPQINGVPAQGIALSANGSYEALTQDAQGDLASFAQTRTGTYEIVDGSATFGAGTYAIRLHPAEGGVSYGQVVVTDSPRQVHFFAPGMQDAPLAPSLPWAPFSPTCACVDATGTKVDPNDASALRAAMVGRWLRCDGVGSSTGVGMEFLADGSWYSINEDAAGALSRGTGSLDHGTSHFVPTSSEGVFVGPEPLAFEVANVHGSTISQAIVTTSPRALRLAVGSTNESGIWRAVWVTMLPLQ